MLTAFSHVIKLWCHWYCQDLFVLLDVIGPSSPMFVNHFKNTTRWFDRLVSAGNECETFVCLLHPF